MHLQAMPANDNLTWGKKLGEMWPIRGCYSPLENTLGWIEARSECYLGELAGDIFWGALLGAEVDISSYTSIRLGCWLNDSKWPVLKHGPRSPPLVRVFGCQTHMRKETEWYESI